MEASERLYYTEFVVPGAEKEFGTILLVCSSKGVIRINFQNGEDCRIEPKDNWIFVDPKTENQIPILTKAKIQLQEYFCGKRKTFDFELDLRGTEFQKSVWTAVSQIPYGSTDTYGHIAQHLGNPKASRAVGAANGRNPVPICVPCHRVIGSSGDLTGYYGGLAIKRNLLQMESTSHEDEISNKQKTKKKRKKTI